MQDGLDDKRSDVVMYTTRFCPYCVQARLLFQQKGVEYQDIAVDADSTLRREMMQKSGRHTVPQIWIGESHIGGCDELFQLERSGQLDEMLIDQSGK